MCIGWLRIQRQECLQLYFVYRSGRRAVRRHAGWLEFSGRRQRPILVDRGLGCDVACGSAWKPSDGPSIRSRPSGRLWPFGRICLDGVAGLKPQAQAPERVPPSTTNPNV